MGPQHPSTHGVLRLEVGLDGEVVTSVRPHIGYLHRCFEKHAEAMTWPQVIPYTDRCDYLAAMNQELSYVLGVERLMGIRVPERVEYIRVIVCELNRIASHLVAVGTYGMDVGAFTPFLWAFTDREKIMDLLEWVSGARLLYNYIWIGGVARDLPEGFEARTVEFLDAFEKNLDEFDDLLTNNAIFIDRTADVGVISPEIARAHALSGPNLRGSGVKRDLRKDEPYSIYDRFEFDVPVGTGQFGKVGSCWDRYWVRIAEMRQSARILRQAVKAVPAGNIKEAVPRRVAPPKGEVYSRSESPRGELGFYIVSDGGLKPNRCKCRSPSFAAVSALPEISPGVLIADLVAIVGSIDIVLGEVDR
ncbi:MAG: NADH-quinone oxidoreductase subunit D [Planctomycetota bacterium]